jgi:hypothetical protein
MGENSPNLVTLAPMYIRTYITPLVRVQRLQYFECEPTTQKNTEVGFSLTYLGMKFCT